MAHIDAAVTEGLADGVAPQSSARAARVVGERVVTTPRTVNALVSPAAGSTRPIVASSYGASRTGRCREDAGRRCPAAPHGVADVRSRGSRCAARARLVVSAAVVFVVERLLVGGENESLLREYDAVRVRPSSRQRGSTSARRTRGRDDADVRTRNRETESITAPRSTLDSTRAAVPRPPAPDRHRRDLEHEASHLDACSRPGGTSTTCSADASRNGCAAPAVTRSWNSILPWPGTSMVPVAPGSMTIAIDPPRRTTMSTRAASPQQLARHEAVAAGLLADGEPTRRVGMRDMERARAPGDHDFDGVRLRVAHWQRRHPSLRVVPRACPVLGSFPVFYVVTPSWRRPTGRGRLRARSAAVDAPAAAAAIAAVAAEEGLATEERLRRSIPGIVMSTAWSS